VLFDIFEATTSIILYIFGWSLNSLIARNSHHADFDNNNKCACRMDFDLIYWCFSRKINEFVLTLICLQHISIRRTRQLYVTGAKTAVYAVILLLITSCVCLDT
jgi:hypothetical protein